MNRMDIESFPNPLRYASEEDPPVWHRVIALQGFDDTPEHQKAPPVEIKPRAGESWWEGSVEEVVEQIEQDTGREVGTTWTRGGCLWVSWV